MKKQLLLVLLIGAFTSNAQTIVSTTPQKKKVILEQFTGFKCQFCPDGAVVSKQIADANPGNVFVIKIHSGSFATPNSSSDRDYRTSFGTALDNQAGAGSTIGYPSGTINRRVFTGSVEAMSRTQWSSRATTVLGEDSYVNVATTATINPTTRQLTVLVEAYYTAASPVATNKLNVALLQDNTVSPQSTTSGYNNTYNHMDRLVHLLTGQYGEDITTTTAGTLVRRTYDYTIPAAYNSVNAVLADLKIVAFVAEGNEIIISGNGVKPTITTLSTSNFEKKIATVYPNPSKGLITLDAESSFDVSIVDFTGKEIYKQSDLINKKEIDLSNVQRGIYFVKMKNEIGEQVEKIMIE